MHPSVYAWACVLAYAWWVARIVLIRPRKARRPRPVYRIKDGKIFRD
jgi:hypothetical protein